MSRNPNPLGSRTGTDLSAFVNGLDARIADEASTNGQLTDCPYSEGTQAASCWWRGYNHPSHNDETEKGSRPAAH